MPYSSGVGRLGVTDPNSFSNPEHARVEKFKIRWTVDFEKRTLSGSVTCNIICTDPTIGYIIFDTNDLRINAIHWPADGRELAFTLGKPFPPFGRSLKIALPELDAEQKTSILIDYETVPSAPGLIWLPPEFTQGKRFPFLFSQAEAIHARSFFPCQDTPSVRASYTSEVIAPKSFSVLMSGISSSEPELINGHHRLHKFCQSHPIASYLVAIVVARLSYIEIGPRTTVWVEDEFMEQAAFDFSETEEMLQMADSILGDYDWGKFDLLVLPKSYPWGGMENPCIAFVSSTLLSGDKSLAPLIAHKITHCWIGNLVGIKTFEHYWLKEGLTIYLERLLLGRTKGEQFRQFLFIEGWNNLRDEINAFGEQNPLTSLVVDLTGINPVILYNKIPYEKGAVFLYFLEMKVGLLQIEAFIRDYLEVNKFKSVDSDDFKEQFIKYFIDLGIGEDIKGIEWDKWLNARGMPIVAPIYDDIFMRACTELKNKWRGWNPAKTSICPFKKEDFDAFIVGGSQIKEFLAGVFADDDPLLITIAKLEAMQTSYDFNSTRNCEIKCLWLRICIKAKWMEQLPEILRFVTEEGRLKYIRPIYKELFDWKEVRHKAIHTFHKNQHGMMIAAIDMIKSDLHLKE